MVEGLLQSVTALFGILLALGELPLTDMPDSPSLIERLADWYANDPSSSIHGATGWLLRHWKQEEVARKVDQIPVPYSPDREWYTLEVKAKVGDFGLDAPGTRTRSLQLGVGDWNEAH